MYQACYYHRITLVQYFHLFATNILKYCIIDILEFNNKGEHPRLGAMDVCPFIPVKGVSMDECIKCANQCAQKLADELGLPCESFFEK